MNSKTLLTATILVVFLSPMTFAANVGTGLVKITHLENWSGQNVIYVKTDQAQITNPGNCITTDKYYLQENASDFSRSVLLAAMMADRPINLVISSTCSSNNRPYIVAVSLVAE